MRRPRAESNHLSFAACSLGMADFGGASRILILFFKSWTPRVTSLVSFLLHVESRPHWNSHMSSCLEVPAIPRAPRVFCKISRPATFPFTHWDVESHLVLSYLACYRLCMLTQESIEAFACIVCTFPTPAQLEKLQKSKSSYDKGWPSSSLTFGVRQTV